MLLGPAAVLDTWSRAHTGLPPSHNTIMHAFCGKSLQRGTVYGRGLGGGGVPYRGGG